MKSQKPNIETELIEMRNDVMFLIRCLEGPAQLISPNFLKRWSWMELSLTTRSMKYVISSIMMLAT